MKSNIRNPKPWECMTASLITSAVLLLLLKQSILIGLEMTFLVSLLSNAFWKVLTKYFREYEGVNGFGKEYFVIPITYAAFLFCAVLAVLRLGHSSVVSIAFMSSILMPIFLKAVLIVWQSYEVNNKYPSLYP